MILNKKLVVVMPAYNAEKTLRQTYEELPHEYVDEVILVDDASKDHTSRLARELGIKTIIHPEKRGYERLVTARPASLFHQKFILQKIGIKSFPIFESKASGKRE